MTKFTDHLLAHSPSAFKAATTHPFLHRAGTSAFPAPALLAWLSQDRLYALSYVSFIGSLLSKSSLPSSASRTQSLEWRIADCLIDALTNIRRELAMFEDILRDEFAWKDGGETPRQETRAYQDLFAGAAAPSQSLLIGMTVLWATEKSYLEAWRFAKGCAGKGDGKDEEEGVLRKTLIPNWTSTEFEGFVDQIGGLVDELAQEVPEGGKEYVKCKEAWRQVLWAEERFWPDIQD